MGPGQHQANGNRKVLGRWQGVHTAILTLAAREDLDGNTDTLYMRILYFMTGFLLIQKQCKSSAPDSALGNLRKI